MPAISLTDNFGNLSENASQKGTNELIMSKYINVQRACELPNIQKPKSCRPKTKQHKKTKSQPLPLDKTVYAVCGVLSQVIKENQLHLERNHKPPLPKVSKKTLQMYEHTPTKTPDTKTIYNFLNVMIYRTRLAHEPTIALLAYVDRLIEKTGLVLCNNNWKLVIFICLVLSQKVFDDLCYDNNDYRKLLPGVTLKQMNDLEIITLKLLDYDVLVSNSLYTKYYIHLQALFKNSLELNTPKGTLSLRRRMNMLSPPASPMIKLGH
eukprot:TRINITY_DN354_c0_g1_i1.p1 TRINITY_DN354_c0_g1~~TRINITY_DN354_c0_g1_i1.p1  ORF type:complete len:265 (+),score=56.72 TRINITY_DN354_c0_g1_i1:200-994(+)